MVTRRNNENDWFYGASASLPTAASWHTWFNYHEDAYKQSQPLERFLIDGTMKMHQTLIKLCVRVRKNAGWTRQFSEVEMNEILEIVGEAQAWFDRNKPREDQMASLDPRLCFIAKALNGLYQVSTALAQELDQINRKGYLLVDAGAESAELATS